MSSQTINGPSDQEQHNELYNRSTELKRIKTEDGEDDITDPDILKMFNKLNN